MYIYIYIYIFIMIYIYIYIYLGSRPSWIHVSLKIAAVSAALIL